MKVNVVTGATGLLGSHIAEQLAARGEKVRALVRPTSDPTLLKSLGVELAVGDLDDLDSLRRAVDGADVVYHCAALVGDWGPRRQFQEQVIGATGRLLDACRAAAVGRVLHVSSISVYGHPVERAGLFTEDEPLGQNLWIWEPYCRAKIQAEELCRRYPGDLTVVRPSWFYGPRDRRSLPRLLQALEAGRVAVIGPGDNQLNMVYAGDVAEGAILAANYPDGKGKVYNLTSAGEVTQRQFLDMVTDGLGRPRVKRHVPIPIAFWLGLLGECIGRVVRMRRSPHVTRYAVQLVTRSTRFSSERALAELGWRPRTPVAEGLRRMLEWHFARAKANAT